MKKAIKVSGSNNGFKPVLPRKKKRGSVLEDGSGDSETGDTTESDSINMEEKCLVEKTSFDYGKGGALAKGDLDQTSTGSKIKTKKALGKPLGKINFSSSDVDDDVLLDALLELPPPLKNLVNISVHKSFALDIGLDKVVGKSSQEKLQVVRKLFSKINDFKGASTPSKFAEIIKASFTFESSLAQASKKAEKAKILVNTNLQKSDCGDKKIPVGTLAEAVHTALSEFGIIKSIKMQLVGLWQKAVVEFEQRDAHRAFLYTLPVETNMYDIWDYVNLVGKKTCIIDHHPVTYAQAKCAIVCFESTEFLNTIMGTTLCEKTGYTSLSFSVSENFSLGKSPYRMLSNVDKSRLAVIYSKHSASIASKIASRSLFPLLPVKNDLINPGFSLKIKPTLPVAFDVKKRFAVLESSFTSLTGQISKLAKRLDLLIPAVFQSSSGLGDIVMREDLSVVTSGKTTALLELFSSPDMVKFKNMLEGLSTSVLSLSAHLDSLVLENIVHWHVESGNMVLIVTEMKLKSGCKLWIINKFDGVRIFSFGVDKRFLGAGVAIIMNNSLAHHVSKIDEIPGRVISVCFLFKGKLLVMVLGLYAGAFFGIRFDQAIESNLRGAKKTIDYIFVSDSLSLAVAGQIVASVSDYFNTDHKAVMVSVGLGGLLNVHLNGLHKQANKNQWKFKIADVNSPKWAYFKEYSLVEFFSVVNEFLVASNGGDFDFMWSCLVKVLVNSADKVFSRHWFREIKCSSNKQSSKFFRLELLVAKLVKSLQSGNAFRTGSLLNAWLIANEYKALEIQDMLNNSASSEDVFVCLSGLKKSYYCSKMHKAKAAEAAVIRHAIDKRMENFYTNKDCMIRSILDRPFHKVVFDHLVMDNELVLDSGKVKSKVDVIMEG
ncbi:hypothetical protein G9A89_020060 [Geosiphon pyriformis]|nr:hypothetical protein G9A89_020060 [Geosiphon pyriformis]